MISTCYDDEPEVKRKLAKVASAGNREFSPEMWMSTVKEEHTEAYKDLTRKELQAAYPCDLQFNATVVIGGKTVG